MGNIKILLFGLVVSSALAVAAFADDNATNSTTSTLPAALSATNAVSAGSVTNATRQARVRPAKQADAASKTAEFGKVAATDDAYKSALDAHALDDALKLVDKDGAFKGTVAKIYEPRGLVILEFDENYRNALTAIVRGTNFGDFPVLTNLIGKDILVTGKFIKYREAAEIVLEKPDQIKVVSKPKETK